MAASTAISGTQDDGSLDRWDKRSACKGVDVNVFFPHPSDDEGIARAKAICFVCPVRRECLNFARFYERMGETNLDLGIYAGLTYDERRKHWRNMADRRRNHAKRP